MISCVIKTNWRITNICSEDTINLNDIPNQYIWSSTSSDLWNRAMQYDDIKSFINSFITKSTQPEASIDNCIGKFYTLLDSISKKAGLKKNRTTQKKHGNVAKIIPKICNWAT